jgi:hypothetical protein
MLLNAAAIIAAKDKRTITVAVPEWGDGGEVLVGSMSALDRARLGDWLLGQQPLPPPESEPQSEEPMVVTCGSPSPAGESLADEADPAPVRYSKEQDLEFLLRYVAGSILDPETYAPAFTVAEIERLGAKDRAPLDRIYAAALALNADTPAAAADVEKNSGGTAASGSGSV